MSQTPCIVPYLNPDCSRTYADALGSAYVVATVLYSLMFWPIFILSAGNVYLLVRKNGWIFDVQHSVSYFVLCGSFFAILRSPDPQGYATLFPMSFIQFSYVFMTGCTFSGFFSVVHSWVAYLGKATFRPSYTRLVKKIYIFSMIVVFSNEVILTSVTVAVGSKWRQDVIKFCVYCVLLALWSICGVYHGMRIYKILIESHKRYGKSQVSSTGDNVDAGQSTQNLQQSTQNLQQSTQSLKTAGSSSSNATGNKSSQPNKTVDRVQHKIMRRRILALRKIYRLNIATTFCSTLAFLALAYNAWSQATNKYDYDSNPKAFPDGPSVGDLFFEFIFDIIIVIVYICSFYFFRYSSPQREKTMENIEIPGGSDQNKSYNTLTKSNGSREQTAERDDSETQPDEEDGLQNAFMVDSDANVASDSLQEIGHQESKIEVVTIPASSLELSTSDDSISGSKEAITNE